MMRWHPEALTKKQAATLRALVPVTNALDFYLAGETAVALYLGHSHSVDLDWFSQKKRKIH